MFRSSKDYTIKQVQDNVHSTDDGYHCDVCGYGPWSNELDVEIHRRNTHKWELVKALKDVNAHMCSVCLRKQGSKKGLRDHILEKHLCCPTNATMINREVFICDHCERLFFNKQLLIAHMYHWHTTKTPKNTHTRFSCPKCAKNIRGKYIWFHLLYHDVFHLGTCPICLQTCENRSAMIEHVKTHPGLFRCNICNYETTKECYLNNHLIKHKKAVQGGLNDDLSRFFLPKQPSSIANNRTYHIFKGISLAPEVKICVLCRALCFSNEEMKRHIYGEHAPEVREKSKSHLCYCGEKFFNSILLKHHIFKSDGHHGVWDGVSPIPSNEVVQEEIVFELFEIGNPAPMGMNEIIISPILDNHEAVLCLPQEPSTLEGRDIVHDFQQMEA